MSVNANNEWSHISVAAYISNILHDNGVLKDNSANLLFDHLTEVLERLAPDVLGEVIADVQDHRIARELEEQDTKTEEEWNEYRKITNRVGAEL